MITDITCKPRILQFGCQQTRPLSLSLNRTQLRFFCTCYMYVQVRICSFPLGKGYKKFHIERQLWFGNKNKIQYLQFWTFCLWDQIFHKYMMQTWVIHSEPFLEQWNIKQGNIILQWLKKATCTKMYVMMKEICTKIQSWL